MRIPRTLLVISCFAVSVAQAQTTDKEKALAKKNEAIELMDNGKLAESITLLEEARKLDPAEPEIVYEMALAKYQQKSFDEAMKLLKELVKKKQATGRVYAMMGNALDEMGKPEKAIDAYDEGIKKFPGEGNLYLERGVMELRRSEYNAALGFFEKGIKAAPMYPSNYYRAAKIFLDSDQEIWGMIYGEIFMNIERGSKRTEEISKLLYYTYKGEIKFESDTTVSVSFAKQNNTIVLDASQSKKAQVSSLASALAEQVMASMGKSFANGAYEMTLVKSIIGEKMINLASLNRIRTKFLDIYTQEGRDTTYPVVLFDFQRKVKEAGHLEAYNYWILGLGDEKVFGEWRSEHEQQWNDFMKWFKENRIKITEENTFIRTQIILADAIKKAAK
ncbi:tetratricopeptide repeat protein [Chitinophaga filiformis]|uniref:TPR repeat-containing protein n=1 Tax=Chitinophaga filiformis TaxID=104663 RepID=A0A1G7GTN3_CHIFI|nr:tetratricopeptide repeat protein [Chitinophaga filiformis]SDE91506.1 TPR repeat-containing protein [Chitinophaga filiformis]